MMDLQKLLTSVSFRYSSEADLQLGLEQLLIARQVAFEREVILSPRDRIDFLVGGVGIEIKVDLSPERVASQLDRYLESEKLASVILFTTRRTHMTIPTSLRGKAVQVILVRSAF